MVANSAAEGIGLPSKPALTLVPRAVSDSYNHGSLAKRSFDALVSALLIALLSPLLLLAVLCILLSSRGPVIFTQRRVGQNGKVFKFFKFRTMYHENDDSIHRAYSERLINGDGLPRESGPKGTFKMTKDPRITPLGAFLRKSSMDELPQLFNVLKGDMSLVGPRPPIEYEVDYYKDWHTQRLQAKPGITGLWQVNGRSRVSFDEMVMLDIKYIEYWSFMLDIKILLRTVPVVLFGVGGY
jgi:lipopolysaccharide/colanic/teichoic acid biosynthesis glycosyltransferase